jgi:hypothetical protein
MLLEIGQRVEGQVVRGIIIKMEFVVTVSKELVPGRCIEVWKTSWVTSNGGEPVVIYDMELRSDGSSVKVQNKRNGGAMTRTESHMHLTIGS